VARAARRLGAGALLEQVNPQRGLGDHVQVEPVEVETAAVAQALETLPHLGQRVLCQVDQRATGQVDGEAAETRRRRGHRDGDVEREPGLVALGLPGADRDRWVRIDRADQPAGPLGSRVELAGAHDTQRRRHGQSALRASTRCEPPTTSWPALLAISSALSASRSIARMLPRESS